MSDDHDLIDLARRVAERAYAPYSGFRVGAVAVDGDGSLHVGCNVENAAYGASICAEANAITAAVAAGAGRLVTVAVACLDGPGCSPCGNCRQLMREFGVETVILTDSAGAPIAHAFEELLPRSFGPSDLDLRRRG